MQKPNVGIVLTGTAALVAVIALAFRTDPGAEQVSAGSPAPVAIITPTAKTYELYDSEDAAVRGFHGGCALVAEYLGIRVNEKGCITPSDFQNYLQSHRIERGKPIANVLIATLPNPFESHLDWLYDGNIDAIRRAFATAGYVPDAFDLQDDGDSLAIAGARSWSSNVQLSTIDSLSKNFPTREPARKYHPGILLFRRAGSARADRARADTVQVNDPVLWIVYVVPELPTTGLNKYAFEAALHDRRNILELFHENVEQKRLRILGPTFSGSSKSLLSMLESEDTNLSSFDSVRIMTGSATSLDPQLVALNSASLKSPSTPDSAGTFPRISIRSTVHSDSSLRIAFAGLINKLKIDPTEVAILSESQTAYGSLGGSSGFLEVPFPLNIASLRAEFDRSSEALEEERELPGLAAATSTTISPESEKHTKESPPITSRLTVPSVDVMVRDIEKTLTLHNTKLIALMATDVRDKLMLMRAIRRRMRDVTFVIFESNILLLRPEYRRATRGAFVLSTYPLVVENEFWNRTADSSPRVLSSFSSDASLGAYNAVLSLLGETGKRRQYVPPGFVATDKLIPPIWVTLVGNDVFLPLYSTIPNGTVYNYFEEYQAHSADSINLEDRRNYAAWHRCVDTLDAKNWKLQRAGNKPPSDSAESWIANANLAGKFDACFQKRDSSTVAAQPYKLRKSSNERTDLTVTVPLLSLLALGFCLLLPVKFEKILPGSMRPVNTSKELMYAVLFLGWCFVVLLPVMAQIQLDAKTWAVQPTWVRAHSLSILNAVGALIILFAMVSARLFRDELRKKFSEPAGRGLRFARSLFAKVFAYIVIALVRGPVLLYDQIKSIRKQPSRVVKNFFNASIFCLRYFFELVCAVRPPAPEVRWEWSNWAAVAKIPQAVSGDERDSVLKDGEHIRRARDEDRHRHWIVEWAAPISIVVFDLVYLVAVMVWSNEASALCSNNCWPAVMFVYRTGDLFSGGSPTMVLCLFGLTFAVWSKWQLDVVKDLKRPSDFEVAMKDVGRDHSTVSALRSVGHDMWRCRATLLDLIPDESAIWLTVCMMFAVIVVLQIGSFGSTLEAVAFDYEITHVAREFRYLVFMGLVGTTITISWGILRFTASWQTLQTLLDLFANCKIIKVFGAIPTDVVRAARPALWGEHNWSSPGFGIRPAPVTMQEVVRSNVASDFRPRVMQTSEANAREKLKSLPDHLVPRHWSNSRAASESESIHCIVLLVEEFGYFDEIGDEVSESAREYFKSRIDPAIQVDLANYFALEIGFFVARIMFVLRRLAVVIVLSLLLAVMFTTAYPFQSQSLLRWGVTGLMVFALASLLTVIARMSTNSVLRQVTQTEDGSSLGATAVFNLLVFAVIPLMGFLATDIPVVRSFLVSWVEPLTHALTK